MPLLVHAEGDEFRAHWTQLFECAPTEAAKALVRASTRRLNAITPDDLKPLLTHPFPEVRLAGIRATAKLAAPRDPARGPHPSRTL